MFTNKQQIITSFTIKTFIVFSLLYFLQITIFNNYFASVLKKRNIDNTLKCKENITTKGH